MFSDDTVIQLNVSDADGPGTDNGIVEFQIQSGANDDFLIDLNTGRISVAQNSQLDKDNQDEYQILVSHFSAIFIGLELMVWLKKVHSLLELTVQFLKAT